MTRSITMSRDFDAPPALVFEAWTHPEMLGWFFNPGHAVAEAPSVDLRVGGQWRQLMVIDARTSYVTGGVYREIVPGKRLVFAMGATDGWPALDLDALDRSPQVTIDFTDLGGRTRMETRLDLPEGYVDTRFRATIEHMRAGWSQTIDRLVAQMAGRRQAPAA